MARYDVRFQLQVGTKDVNHDNYHSNERPCSKRDALNHLASLWAKEKDYFRDSSWNQSFKQAIEKAERAVNNASNVSASQNRNFYSTTFEHNGSTYRVDIAIEAGDGHFS